MIVSSGYKSPASEPGSKVPTTVDGSGGMFDRIAHRYDRLNRLMSFGMDRRWRGHLTRSLFDGPADGSYKALDLATGTADVAIDIARLWPAAHVIGLDSSEGMLNVGRAKIDRKKLTERVELVSGDAQALPFESGDFDAASIAFGIRNVPDRQKALSEMARVIRPGGRVAILELCEPRDGLMSGLARFHVRHVVPRLGAWLSGAAEYRYLQQSMAAFPQPDVFVAMMEAAGLSHVSLKRFAFGAAHLFVGERVLGGERQEAPPN